MILGEEEKPSLDELVHFGVKGMKWGVRKKREPVSLAEGYNKQHYNIDHRTYGRRGADRINERVKSGSPLKVARQAETDLHHKRIRNVRLAVVGAYLLLQFAPLLQVSANNMAKNYVNKKHMQKGAKAAANLFSDKRGIPNYSTISATFNNTTGIWE